MSVQSRIQKARRAELDRSTRELHSLKSELDEAYRLFDQSLDPTLTESCIFQINALNSRYDHTLKGIKSMFL